MKWGRKHKWRSSSCSRGSIATRRGHHPHHLLRDNLSVHHGNLARAWLAKIRAFRCTSRPAVAAECLNLSVTPPSGFTYFDWSNSSDFGQNVQMSTSSTNICFIDFMEANQSDGYMSAYRYDDGTHWQLPALRPQAVPRAGSPTHDRAATP